MPPANQEKANKPLRVMAYGPPKAKKTWWAAKAAEAGFNVIVIDGDDGAHIINQVEAKAQERIQVIDAVDSLNDASMARFMTHMLKGSLFYWDEDAKQKTITPKNCKPDHAHYKIDVSKLTTNDVLVIDSWTALSWSVAFRFCIENNIDLADAAKTEWDGYRWAGALMNWMLNQLKSLPCHIIVIGHQDTYEKKKADGKTVKFSRMQAKSISGPHAMQLAKHFSDVLWFKIQGSQFKIDTRADSDRDGGSRNIKPEQLDWEALQFKDIVKAAGFTQEDKPLEAFTYFPAGVPLVTDGTKDQQKNDQPLKAATAGKPEASAAMSNLLKR